MSKELAEKLNHSDILEKALEIFSDQSLINAEDGDKQTLKDLQLKRERANQLLDALSNFVEFSDRLEVLASDKKKFKREEELELLHSHFRTAKTLAAQKEKIAEIAAERLDALLGDPDNASAEQLAMLSNIVDSTIDSHLKLLSGSQRLMRTERDTGGRPYGHKRQRGTAAPMIVLEKEVADESDYDDKNVIEIDPNNPEAFFNE